MQGSVSVPRDAASEARHALWESRVTDSTFSRHAALTGAPVIRFGLCRQESLRGSLRDKPAGNQQQAWPCMSRTVHARYTIRFPATVRVTAIPKAVSYHDDQVHFQSTYRQSGREVTVERSLVIDRPSQVCSAPDRDQWHALN